MKDQFSKHLFGVPYAELPLASEIITDLTHEACYSRWSEYYAVIMHTPSLHRFTALNRTTVCQ